jgi:ribosome maturation factor RimP
MARSTVSEAVSRLIEPVARDHGLSLVDVEFRPQGRRSVLRLILDREGGVGLDDLSNLSREASDLLDVHDVVPGVYVLECSSPGVNRPLRRAEDFARFVGKAVRVRMHSPISGGRSFSGRLVASSGETIELEDSVRGVVVLPLAEIERANYEHDFAEDLRARRP